MMEDGSATLALEGAMPARVVRLRLVPVDLQLGDGERAHKAAADRLSGMGESTGIAATTLRDICHASLFHRGEDLIGFLHTLGHGALGEDMFTGLGSGDDRYATNRWICENEDRVDLRVF